MNSLQNSAFEHARAILAKLVSFGTITDEPNRPVIDYVAGLLAAAGFQLQRVNSADGRKQGLLAQFGTGPGSVILSAHSDVVPVTGQAWSRDPFCLEQADGRLYGRGTTDMLGFLACALAVAETLRDAPPAMPIGIILSFDEEIGVRGIQEMLPQINTFFDRPRLCLVGEPTGMQIATSHKGKASFRGLARGTSGHSALAPAFQNAIHGACDLVAALRSLQTELIDSGPRDLLAEPPFATVHAGVIQGGQTLNVVPAEAEVLFEIRYPGQTTAEAILASLVVPENVTVTQTGAYPGLTTDVDCAITDMLLRQNHQTAGVSLAFGTEAGYFQQMGIPTLVCGPGFMSDGHQPDESIDIAQLHACLHMLHSLVRQDLPGL